MTKRHINQVIDVAVTFLVSTHNEPQALDLIDLLKRHLGVHDEIVVLNDPVVEEYEAKLKATGATVVNHKLVYSYSEHRNTALPYCKGEFIFVLDADETPAEFLLDNLKIIIKNTPADLIWLPRLNIFEGVTPADAETYGWHLQDGLVNWKQGDYQCRIFRNGIGLKWHGKLHETIKTKADTKQVFLAKHTKMALIHRKTIEQQRANNARYANVYTESENKSIIEPSET